MIRRLVFLCLLAAAAVAPAQTTGMPFINDLYVAIPPGPGTLAGPPFGVPCPALPVVLPAGTVFSINLTTPAPGLTFILFVDLATPPCAPAAFCLPPVAGPYAVLPLGLCGTGQSVDIISATPGIDGVTAPSIGGGIFATPPVVSPGIGLPISLQAAFFDPASMSPLFGMVVSNAVDLII